MNVLINALQVESFCPVQNKRLQQKFIRLRNDQQMKDQQVCKQSGLCKLNYRIPHLLTYLHLGLLTKTGKLIERTDC